MAKRKQGMHVTRHAKGGWQAKRGGAKRASARARTQAGADRRGRKILKNGTGGELITHGRNGRFRSKDTIPPAPDPFPPRDTEH